MGCCFKICCQAICLDTSPTEREEKIKEEFWDFFWNFWRAIFIILLAIYYALNYRKSLVTETSSYNDNSSFAFKNLSIIIEGDFNISVWIDYESEKYGKYKNIRAPPNEREINIKSLLNVSELILEKEYDDKLDIYFKINDQKTKNKKGKIIINNEIYFFNYSNYEIEPFSRYQIFYIEDELSSLHFNNEFKRYQCYVHSRLIENLKESKNFSIIDKHENFRIIHDEGNHPFFAFRLTKRKFLSHLKVTKEDFIDKFFLIFGILDFTFQIFCPLMCEFKDICKKKCYDENSSEEQPLRENERASREMEMRHREDDKNN